MAVIKRIWEIDFLRGVAILLMIIFHLVVDLADFYHYRLNYMSGFWYYVGKLSAVMFLFLAGVSTRFNGQCLGHGIKILGWGMVVTLVTYVIYPSAYVRFGILHLIGTGLLLCYFLRNSFGWGKFLLALMLLIGGVFAKKMEVTQEWLLPLGIAPAGFTSLDYYPIIPWGGVILLGSWAGSRIYKSPESIFKQEYNSNVLTYLGRRSLWIYLLHQPILLALLWVAFRG